MKSWKIFILPMLFIFTIVYAQQIKSIDDFIKPVEGKRNRVSSYGKNGEYSDFIMIPVNQKAELLNLVNISGCVQRIWMTIATDDSMYLQHVKINMIFDGQLTVKSVPIGFFTGTGPWRVNDLTTPVLNVMRARPGNKDREGVGSGSFNIHWPMPFMSDVKMEIINSSQTEVMLFYHVDYIECTHVVPPLLFHADYQIKSPTLPGKQTLTLPRSQTFTVNNDSNYVFLFKEGYQGKYVGTVLCVESHPDRKGKWYEGDDMFVIDNEPWPPRLHGTGTEDYFGMAWGIHRPYQAFDHGVSHYERNITDHDRFYDGRFVLYRWHLNDPILFNKSIHASIEAGHANECAQHYESLAFWYGKKSD